MGDFVATFSYPEQDRRGNVNCGYFTLMAAADSYVHAIMRFQEEILAMKSGEELFANIDA